MAGQLLMELIDAIEEYLADRNATPKRYVWRAKGEEILRKIAKAKAALQAQLDLMQVNSVPLH